MLYNTTLTEDEAEQWLASKRVSIERIETSEDLVLSTVGHDLCEKIFRGYTLKQWELDLSQLSAGVAARIPTRTNDDDRYFTDKYQFMPKNGYSSLFSEIVNHKRIRIELETDYFAVRDRINPLHCVYTGPIDAYFNYKYGKLPYRSLKFEHRHIPNIKFFQSVGTVNFPNEHKYTRITEFKHLTGQTCQSTSLVYEYPSALGDPYYPIPRQINQDLYLRYKSLSESLVNVSFVGRLAQYKYYNMDQVVAAALTVPLPD